MGFFQWLGNLFKKKEKKPLKTAIVFSGGGTRGFAYIGVIKAFKEAGIDFDIVAGTSVGSIIGAFYAAGVPVEDMEKRALTMKRGDIFSSKFVLFPSKTKRLEAFVSEFLQGKTFADLKKPLCVVAVDIKSGQEIHIKEGDLIKAVAGSCAIPGIFNPVDYGEYRLLDGGLKNNIPADAARELGADIVISLDINPTRGYGTDSEKTLDLLMASLRVLMKSNAVNGFVHSDYIIKIDLSKFSQLKVKDMEEMIKIGYDVTKENMPEILKALGRETPDENIKRVSRKIRAIERKKKREQARLEKQALRKLAVEAKEESDGKEENNV